MAEKSTEANQEVLQTVQELGEQVAAMRTQLAEIQFVIDAAGCIKMFHDVMESMDPKQTAAFNKRVGLVLT